jgi:hypothetical protein
MNEIDVVAVRDFEKLHAERHAGDDDIWVFCGEDGSQKLDLRRMELPFRTSGEGYRAGHEPGVPARV